MLALALAAGIGVAGLAAAASDATPAASRAAVDVHAPQQPPANDRPGRLTASAANAAKPSRTPTRTPQPPAAPLGFARAQQKPRPVIVVSPIWVHPLPEARVTSCFGQRWGRLHAGIDLATVAGTRIRAAGAGTVVRAGAEGGYGNAVLIDHGNGYLTHYGHMSVVTVQAGAKVDTGQQIGKEGDTGHSTGPHLHFEVHRGSYNNPIEPTAWLHKRGVDIAGCVALTGSKKG